MKVSKSENDLTHFVQEYDDNKKFKKYPLNPKCYERHTENQ